MNYVLLYARQEWPFNLPLMGKELNASRTADLWAQISESDLRGQKSDFGIRLGLGSPAFPGW